VPSRSVICGDPMLSMTTDYAASVGDPSPYLRRIADAGFSHVHWCHQWNTDFLYSRHEVQQVAAWLSECGLALLDLHGSVGPEKNWADEEEYRRLAGVDMVKNRLEMTARLGGDVVIMHSGLRGASEEPLRRSLDAIQPYARDLGVRIAIENGDWALIRRILGEYPPDYVGLCYDSGHGNIPGDGLSELESAKDRLISIHLHDNDGTSDQHRLPFSGTVDWATLAAILARSAYAKCVSMEVGIGNEGIDDEDEFLTKAFEVGLRFSTMVEDARAGTTGQGADP